MTAPVKAERSKNHCFPGEIIRHSVWLSSRFTLSNRDVQELLCERGITVSHAAIRQWCQKFGQAYANQLRRRRPRPGDTWHLDEVVLTRHGKRHSLWRAVDHDDHVLDILVQSRHHTQAAKKCFRMLLKGLTYVPRVIITDKLKRYGATKREMLPGVEHRQSRYRMNRYENSHRPTCQREHRMQGMHVRRACAAILGRVWPDCPTLSPEAASAVRAAVPPRDAAAMCELGRSNRDIAGRLKGGSVAIASGKSLLLPGDHMIPRNLTMPKSSKRLTPLMSRKLV